MSLSGGIKEQCRQQLWLYGEHNQELSQRGKRQGYPPCITPAEISNSSVAPSGVTTIARVPEYITSIAPSSLSGILGDLNHFTPMDRIDEVLTFETSTPPFYLTVEYFTLSIRLIISLFGLLISLLPVNAFCTLLTTVEPLQKATSLQRPLTSVSNVAVVESFY